ncbi:MAG: leucine-rich repeat domain-containing protein [Prevotella sp.]|nr:leucine-rich repeat domain-containing protein [Prevotella sp.]
MNDIENKQFYVYGGENDGNVCTTVQVAVAKSRGWTPWYYYEGTGEEGEYAGSDATSSSDVAINETNFPDANFRNYLLAQDYGQDGILTEEEIRNITSIEVSYKQISSLQGIEFFTALTDLSCLGNQLTSLDVSHNTALTNLSCSYNQLTSLDVSHNTALTELSCSSNRLTSLDVSQNTALTELSCSSNQLTSLDVSHNMALAYLDCGSNQLTSLDVSQHTALAYLDCGSNQLTSLDVSQNTALTRLDCSNNQLPSLDVSKNTALTMLFCYSNQLTSLDVSHNTALTWLECHNNQLTSLDVSQNTALKGLYCRDNQLTSLDVSQNTALGDLLCNFNQLTSLDVSQNTALKRLRCYNNQIKGTEMDKLVNSLPVNDIKNKQFYVYGGENDGNVCTTVQVAVAKSRGWTPMYCYESPWEQGEYAGSDPSGIEDVTISGIEDAPVYNLSGQRLSAPQKGINIVNGKKVISLRSK